MTQPVLSRPVTDRAPGVLAVVSHLFERLNGRNVVYCHWKSNEHLDAGVRGATDLDVLVDRDTGPALASILEEAGYKRILAVPERAYAGVEDYLALDSDTGRLAHLHLHYRLVLGERHLKGYSIPWESLVLGSRRLDSATGIYVCDPNMELLLLVIRAALKLRHRDFLAPPWNVPTLPSDTIDEFLWLVARIDPERLGKLSRELVGKEAAELLVRMTAGILTRREVYAFAQAAEPVLRAYRTYGPVEALRRRWGREAVARWGKLRNRLLEDSLPTKHTLSRGGLIIAVLGSDGAGKSTVVREVTSWLSWKLDVRPIYLGSGDGPASLLRRPLQAVVALRTRIRGGTGVQSLHSPTPSENGRTAARSLARATWRCCWGLSLAREKLGRLAAARRARNLGMVAICDRYPQSQFAGFNDGPQLGDWLQHSSRLVRAMAKWELAAYRSAEQSPPDLVIKLHVTPAVASRRKDDMAQSDISRRVAATRDLRFPAAVRVADIDATQPLAGVLLQVKQVIWEAL